MPGVPSAEEPPALPATELAVRLAEAYRLIAELTALAGLLAAQVERLSARVEELEPADGQGLVHLIASPFLR